MRLVRKVYNVKYPYLGLHNLIQIQFTVTHIGPLSSCTSADMFQAEGILEVTYEDENGATATSRFTTVVRTDLTGQIIVVSVNSLPE